MNLYEKYDAGQFKSISKKRIPYKDEIKDFDVVEVDISELKYNVLNGRIAELDLDSNLDSSFGSATYKEIKNAITSVGEKDIKELSKDIAKVGGIVEPLIINRDGIIADGNRRYTSLNRLILAEDTFSDYSIDINKLQKVPVVIFDEPSDSVNLKEIEYTIQYDDMKKPYDAIARAFDFAKSVSTKKMTVDRISKLTGKSNTEIEKDIRTVELIRTWLHFFEEDKNIKLAINLKLDGPFKEIAGEKNRSARFLSEPQLLVKVVDLVFKSSNKSKNLVMRSIVTGKKDKNVLKTASIKSKVEKVFNKSDWNEKVEKVKLAKSVAEKVAILAPRDADLNEKQKMAQREADIAIYEITNPQLEGVSKDKLSRAIINLKKLILETKYGDKEKNELLNLVEFINEKSK